MVVVDFCCFGSCLIVNIRVLPFWHDPFFSLRAYLYQYLKAQSDDSCHLYSSIVPSIHIVPFNVSNSKRNWAKFGVGVNVWTRAYLIPERNRTVRRQEEGKNSVYLFVFCMNLRKINALITISCCKMTLSPTIWSDLSPTIWSDIVRVDI
jgi:hypothetical protein